jgi:hypothetical protein
MVAPPALTAHKLPVRNRELVTGQIIAKERSTFRPSSRLPALDSLPCLISRHTARGELQQRSADFQAEAQ